MKKIRYILCALMLLVAGVTAYAQDAPKHFDIQVTVNGEGKCSSTNAEYIKFYKQTVNNEYTTVQCKIFGTEQPLIEILHGNHYNITTQLLGDIVRGNDPDLPDGDFAAHAPKRTNVAPTVTYPTLEGPALVLMNGTDDPNIFYLEYVDTIRLVRDGDNYFVYKVDGQGTDASYDGSDYPVSSVTEVYFMAPHDYQVVRDEEDNPLWVWADDYSTAKLEVMCTNNQGHWDSQTVATTSEVTTLPTTEEEGELTYTAKVIYNGEEYVGTETYAIPILTEENTTTVTEDITPANNSVTVIAATTESLTKTHTVTAPTNGIAHIVLAGNDTEGAAANVNVSVPAGATINITSSEGMTIIKGNISVAEGGTINLSNVKVDGTVNGTINVNKNTSIDITDATVTGKINAADATVIAGAAEIKGLTVKEEGNQVATSVNLADGVAASCPIEFTVPCDKVTVERQLISGVSGTMMLSCTVPVSEVSGADIYEFTGVKPDMSRVDMTEVETGNLEAFKPYCIIPTADKITILNDDATFPKTPSEMGATTVGDWKFVAVNKAKVWKEGDSDLGRVYGFAAEEKDNVSAGTFVKAVAGASVAAGRCILVAPDEPSEAKGINGVATSQLPASIKVYFHNADETTGIAELNTATGEMSPVQWYDLNGRLISQPTKGSIYIKGNKKVMVK